MREIKFRAWIPKPVNDAYIEEPQDDHSDFRGSKAANGGIMFYQEDQYLSSFLRRANMMASDREHDSYAEDRLIFLQYTGLKDKNGVEIYEGDILELLKRGHEPYHSIVAWDERMCGFHFFRGANNKTGGITITGLHHPLTWPDKMAVIGNPYENPELIKQGSSK